MIRPMRVLFFLAICFVSAPVFCIAQTTSGKVQINATVKDQIEGVAIPYAHFWIHEEAKGLCLEAKSDGHGRFSIQLQPGYYDVLIGASGFAPFSRRILVTVEKPLNLDIRLGADIESTQPD